MKIKYIKNNKEYIEYSPKGSEFLYNSKIGNIVLYIANKRWLSSLVGSIMNTRLSKLFINSFIKNNNIDMSLYENTNYKCFNDFFTRKLINIKIDKNKNSLISPADSKLIVYKIDDKLQVNIKQHNYKIEELLKDKELASYYKDGYLLVFRLCVTDYHRYCYIDSGKLIKTKKINGLFHTVGPIAFKKYKVFKENQREYSILDTDNFGQVIQMEVGALMIGKIRNNNIKDFKKGNEKGYFLFGGSTICVFLKDVKINKEILNYSDKGIEVEVKIGSKLGEKQNVF